jgi:hypothetical protein
MMKPSSVAIIAEVRLNRPNRAQTTAASNTQRPTSIVVGFSWVIQVHQQHNFGSETKSLGRSA